MNILNWFFKPKKRKKVTNPITKDKKEVEHLRLQAKEYLPKRISELSEEHGFKYNSLRIKNVRTIWGSCSIKNNINLNLNSIWLVTTLLDSAI